MEYVIRLFRDDEAGVWIAENEYIPIILESESLDELMEKVRKAIPEMIEINKLPVAKYIYFIAERREEVVA